MKNVRVKIISVLFIVNMNSSCDIPEGGMLEDQKEYIENKDQRSQDSIDLSKIGPLEITINDGSRDFLIKNQEDTIEFKAENLPLQNQTISIRNAHIRKIHQGWIIKPLNNSDTVKVYLGYKKDYYSKEKIIDSTLVEIK